MVRRIIDAGRKPAEAAAAGLSERDKYPICFQISRPAKYFPILMNIILSQ